MIKKENFSRQNSNRLAFQAGIRVRRIYTKSMMWWDDAKSKYFIFELIIIQSLMGLPFFAMLDFMNFSIRRRAKRQTLTEMLKKQIQVYKLLLSMSLKNKNKYVLNSWFEWGIVNSWSSCKYSGFKLVFCPCPEGRAQNHLWMIIYLILS